eukprot:TRINITY_DN16153_c0_g1_i1.p1 TRINITY_DN16153_c0_g1~~TRINITY_DN16153_c0_g1_i1.p1  ORF type:complete len:274 (+),score=61.01 TRINITY_DN16153_c0_g1_i1:127-948(+)
MSRVANHGASKCSVRFGQCVAYFPSPDDAALFALRCSSQHRPDSKGLGEKHFALQVSDVAHEFLSEINAKFQLFGTARKNLGTALRVAEVRAALGESVLRDAEYIARGADAFRHLSSSDMSKSLTQLSLQLRLLAAPAKQPKMNGFKQQEAEEPESMKYASTMPDPFVQKSPTGDALVGCLPGSPAVSAPTKKQEKTFSQKVVDAPPDAFCIRGCGRLRRGMSAANTDQPGSCDVCYEDFTRADVLDCSQCAFWLCNACRDKLFNDEASVPDD